MFKRDALTAEDSGELVLRLLREETSASDLSRAASTSDPGQRTANSSIPFLLAGSRRVIPTAPDTMKSTEAKQFSLKQSDILAVIATITPISLILPINSDIVLPLEADPTRHWRAIGRGKYGQPVTFTRQRSTLLLGANDLSRMTLNLLFAQS